MGKAASGDYISQGYQDRIEISLANISRASEDKFILVGMKYLPKTFKCELCGHEPCLYAYSVKNLETDIVIDVGSECIKHFKAKGCNIDVASGLKKRIKSTIRQMKRYMKNNLDEAEYKDMTKEKKRELVIRLFMKHQAIQALKDDGTQKKSLLQKEDVLRIIQDCPDIEPVTPKKLTLKPVADPAREALKKAEEELAQFTNKADLTDEEKKAKKRAQDKVRYYKNKVVNNAQPQAVSMAVAAMAP